MKLAWKAYAKRARAKEEMAERRAEMRREKIRSNWDEKFAETPPEMTTLNEFCLEHGCSYTSAEKHAASRGASFLKRDKRNKTSTISRAKA